MCIACPLAGTLMPANGQAMHIYAVKYASWVLIRASQAEHIHFPAGRHERLGLASNASILLVVSVDDHAYGPSRRRFGH